MHAVGIASAAVLYQIILSNRTTNAEYLAARHLKQLSALISLTCLILGILIHVGPMHTATPPRKHVLVCYSPGVGAWGWVQSVLRAPPVHGPRLPPDTRPAGLLCHHAHHQRRSELGLNATRALSSVPESKQSEVPVKYVIRRGGVMHGGAGV